MSDIGTTPVAVQDQADERRLVELFSFGFDRWLVKERPSEVFDRIRAIDNNPIGRAELNQLLHLCHEPGVSESFFCLLLAICPAISPLRSGEDARL